MTVQFAVIIIAFNLITAAIDVYRLDLFPKSKGQC